MSEPERILLETKRFNVVLRSYHTPDGCQHTREVVEHPGAVTIIPLLEGDRVCLVRNFRLSVGETLVELPAGTLEAGEDPSDTALRELTEETGYTASNIEEICEFAMSPGILSERMRLYVASGLTAGQQHLDEGEVIQTLVVPWSEAMRMVDQREIHDAKTLVGLLYYDRLRAQRNRG